MKTDFVTVSWFINNCGSWLLLSQSQLVIQSQDTKDNNILGNSKQFCSLEPLSFFLKAHGIPKGQWGTRIQKKEVVALEKRLVFLIMKPCQVLHKRQRRELSLPSPDGLRFLTGVLTYIQLFKWDGAWFNIGLYFTSRTDGLGKRLRGTFMF